MNIFFSVKHPLITKIPASKSFNPTIIFSKVAILIRTMATQAGPTPPKSSYGPSTDVHEFHDVLKSSKRILALCGAGLSAASGLGTFRGAGGMVCFLFSFSCLITMLETRFITLMQPVTNLYGSWIFWFIGIHRKYVLTNNVLVEKSSSNDTGYP